MRPVRWARSMLAHGGGGFEYFFGFLGGETNQWYPDFVEYTVNDGGTRHTGGRLSLDARG